MNSYFFLRLKRTTHLANWSAIHQQFNTGVQKPTVKRLVSLEDGIIKVNSLLIASLLFIQSYNLLLTVTASTQVLGFRIFLTQPGRSLNAGYSQSSQSSQSSKSSQSQYPSHAYRPSHHSFSCQPCHHSYPSHLSYPNHPSHPSRPVQPSSPSHLSNLNPPTIGDKLLRYCT